MQKFIASATLILLFSGVTFAQNVGIGTASPNASALLELQSTNKGLLLPRVADTSAVPSPAKGLLIFANSTNSAWFYDGAKWQETANDNLWNKYQDSIAITQKRYVGINTDYNLYPPKEGIQANGSLLIHSKIIYTKASPTAAQTYTMNNLPTFVTYYDSVVRIFDPGGAANYFNLSQGNIGLLLTLAPTGAAIGYQITFNPADFGIAAGDTLWVGNAGFPECRTNFTQRFTNTIQVPADFIVNGNTAVTFRSDGDNINSKGFDITCRALFPKSTNERTIMPLGNALMFNTSNGSFMAGATNVIGEQPATAIGNNNKATGNYSTAIGSNNTASGEQSIAFGNSTSAIGPYSMAIGGLTTASGFFATAIGNATIASGQAATATGVTSNASGYASTAMGAGTISSGNSSTAMGSSTISSGDYSTTMGQSTTASGNNSIATGLNSIASGYYSTAMGQSTSANGNSSVATGLSTIASGDYSTTFGIGTISKSYNSLAIGRFNDTIASSTPTAWVATDPLLYLGNGTAINSRSNAMVVYKNANVDLNGYTRLGKASEASPAIKTVELSGTTSAVNNGSQPINLLGIDATKVLSVSVLVGIAGNAVWIPPAYDNDPRLKYNYFVHTNGNIYIQNSSSNCVLAGDHICSKPVKILITYKE